MHCPNCGRKLQKNSRFCPYCGYQLQQNQLNYSQINTNPIPPRQPPHKKHHFFRNTTIIIILLALGAGGAYMYNNHNNNQGTSVSKQSSNKPNSNNSNNHHVSKKPNNQNNQSHNIAKKPSAKTTLNNNQAENKHGYTLATFPKSIQGTWYSYDDGNLFVLHISSNAISSNQDGGSNPLHSRPIKTDATKASHHPNWMIAMPAKKIRGLDLIQTLGWNQSAGDGESFGLINYNGMPVLEEDDGANDWTDDNFFRSKSQAKQNKKKTLPHEIKRPNV